MQINSCIYFEVCGFWYMLRALHNHVSQEPCSRGEYTQTRGPRRSKFIDEGLCGVLNGVGAWTGAWAGVEKKKPHPGLLTRGEWGIGAGAWWFRGPRAPITNTTAMVR